MKQLYVLLLFAAFSIVQQQTVSAQTTTAVKYVRLDIGHGGLHCPFLGPQLEKRLNETGQVSNLKVYKKESYATFELPAATELSDADIRQVAIKVGYPDADVTVVVSDTSPTNQQ